MDINIINFILSNKEEIMDEREDVRKGLEKEIFETCKKENRNPNGAEILILSNFEEQRFFEMVCPGVDEMLRWREKAITERASTAIKVTQKLSDLK
jgi:hypothetical protein